MRRKVSPEPLHRERARNALGLFISLGLATTGTAAAELLPPVGDHLAELLAPAMRKEDEAVSRQLQRALAADPTWFQAYLKGQRVQPGEPLPYHQKLGVTKDQYESFLRSSKKVTVVGQNSVPAVSPMRVPARRPRS